VIAVARFSRSGPAVPAARRGLVGECLDDGRSPRQDALLGQDELRRAGVPSKHIHREHFDWR